MPPWFTGQMAESRMADRRREAEARRSVSFTSAHPPAPLVVSLRLVRGWPVGPVRRSSPVGDVWPGLTRSWSDRQAEPQAALPEPVPQLDDDDRNAEPMTPAVVG